MLGRLHHDSVTGGQCRGKLPCLHQHRIIPGNDLSHDPHRLVPCVAEEFAIYGNRLSLNLVCPSSEIAIASDRLRNIHGLSHGKRLAVVKGLQPRQFVGMFFDQVCKTVKQPSPLRCAHLPPRAFERRSCCLNGLLDVGLVGFGNLADLLACRGIDCCEGPAGLAGDPAVVDQELCRRRNNLGGRESWQDRNHRT